jgi:hypothetical protein
LLIQIDRAEHRHLTAEVRSRLLLHTAGTLLSFPDSLLKPYSGFELQNSIWEVFPKETIANPNAQT